MENLFTIYALTDPETNVIRYVGKAINPEGRLRQHRKGLGNTHRANWVRSLQKRGLQPGMVVCDTCDDEATANELERAWIKLLRAAGVLLTNCTDGGDGLCGLVFTTEHRAKLSVAGKTRYCTKEARAKTSAAQKGHHFSEETRKKIGAAGKGRHPTEEARTKMSAASKSRHHTDETRAKQSVARHRWWARKKAEGRS